MLFIFSGMRLALAEIPIAYLEIIPLLMRMTWQRFGGFGAIYFEELFTGECKMLRYKFNDKTVLKLGHLKIS